MLASFETAHRDEAARQLIVIQSQTVVDIGWSNATPSKVP
jgi:hypothetical protein